MSSTRCDCKADDDDVNIVTVTPSINAIKWRSIVFCSILWPLRGATSPDRPVSVQTYWHSMKFIRDIKKYSDALKGVASHPYMIHLPFSWNYDGLIIQYFMSEKKTRQRHMLIQQSASRKSKRTDSKRLLLLCPVTQTSIRKVQLDLLLYTSTTSNQLMLSLSSSIRNNRSRTFFETQLPSN